MSKPKVDPEKIVKHAQLSPWLNNHQLAQVFEIEESSVRRAFKKLGFAREVNKKEPEDDLTPVVNEEVEDPLEIWGDSLLMADVHDPITDEKYVDKALWRADSMGAGKVIFSGDFWHCDQYGNYYPKQAGIGLDVELPHGNRLMERILSNFDQGYFIKGNHDYRYVKGAKYRLSFVDAMWKAFEPLSSQAKAKLQFSNLDHLILSNGWGQYHDPDLDWYICHPEQYSRTPLTQAIKIAAVENMNVYTAHSHHCARGYAVNGTHQVMEGGGFFDRKKTAYLQRTGAFPKWTQGYAIYKDGRMQLYSPAWED